MLVTSWNWVYLCDFSSAFKPVYLPEDDPSEFSYYFDMSGRRTCYVAPERFFPADSEIARKVASLEVGRSLGRITEAMDVFSLGCVLGELLVEGAPPFTLSQLYKYKAGQYALDAYLAQIEDDAMRVRCLMICQPLLASRYLCRFAGPRQEHDVAARVRPPFLPAVPDRRLRCSIPCVLLRLLSRLHRDDQ